MTNNNKKRNITVNELITKFNLKRDEQGKWGFLNEHIDAVQHMDYSSVVALADMIVNRSCLDKEGNIKIDSCMKYLLYVFTLFNSYTNVTVDASNWSYEYDQLDKYGLVDMVISMIPEKEVQKLNKTVSMKTNDLIENENNVRNFLNKKFEELKPFIGENLNKFIEYAMSVVQETYEQ